MRIILNESTETIHKPSQNADFQPARCGALRHVPEDRIRATNRDELELKHEIDRCGRCFEDSGGY